MSNSDKDRSSRTIREAAEDALSRLNPYPQRGVEVFDRAVRIIARDGGEFFFPDATAIFWSNPADRDRRWLLVWTEHYGYHAFALEDLKYHGIFVRTEFDQLDQLDESLLRLSGGAVELRRVAVAVRYAKEDAAERFAAGLPPRPLLVGEVNPYGSNPDYALWPYPEHASGSRLCRLVMGLQPVDYLRRFDRANLCEGRWSLKLAREAALGLLSARRGGPIVLCGQLVCAAFRVPFAPTTVWQLAWEEGESEPRLAAWAGSGWPLVILNHPSGRCRAWNEPGAFAAARVTLAAAGIDLSPSTEEGADE